MAESVCLWTIFIAGIRSHLHFTQCHAQSSLLTSCTVSRSNKKYLFSERMFLFWSELVAHLRHGFSSRWRAEIHWPAISADGSFSLARTRTSFTATPLQKTKENGCFLRRMKPLKKKTLKKTHTKLTSATKIKEEIKATALDPNTHTPHTYNAGL